MAAGSVNTACHIHRQPGQSTLGATDMSTDTSGIGGVYAAEGEPSPRGRGVNSCLRQLTRRTSSTYRY